MRPTSLPLPHLLPPLGQHKKCIWLKVKSEMLSLTILVHVLEIFSRFLVLPFKCEAYKEARKLIHSGISELLAGSVGQ